MKKLSFIWLLLSSISILAQEKAQTFSLNEAVEYTLQNNYDVLTAQVDLAKAQKQVWEATATGLPQISATSDYNYNIDIPTAYFNGQEVAMGSKKSLSFGATASQLLFSGAYIVGLQSAKAYKDISNMSIEKTKASLKEAVINAYAGVVIADENLTILEHNIEVAEKNYQDIYETFKVGLTEEQNVDQLNYTLTQLKTTRNVAKRQKESAINSLKFLMGVPQDEKINLSTTLDDLMQENLNLMSNDLTSDVKNHIDYRIANHQILTSELQVKLQKSQALPTLSTYLSYTKNSYTDKSDLFSGFKTWFPTTIWGVSLNIPIFSSLSRTAQTQQAKLDLENAKINKEEVEEELVQNLKNAQLAYESAMESYYTSKDLVALSQKIYDKENIKFTEGLTTSTDLTTSETQLYDSQSQYIQAIFDVIQSKTALYQALGKY